MAGIALDLSLLVVGITVLYFGAEWLVRGSVRLASSIGVSPIVVGLTVVSLGTSAPELVVCVVASLGGNSDLAIGNVMGSNMANIGLILGLTALVRPIDVQSRVVHREVPIMLLVTFSVFPLFFDGLLSRVDGVLLLAFLLAYLVFAFRSVSNEASPPTPQHLGLAKESAKASVALQLQDVLLVFSGSGFLVLGGYFIVEAAVGVASALGISQVVIGLTVVAVGTSLPELATSIVAAARRQADIAVGNVIGSNIFNIAAILGTTSLVRPISIPESVLRQELPAVVFMSVLLLPLLRSGWKLRRWEGALLVAVYVGIGFVLLGPMS